MTHIVIANFRTGKIMEVLAIFSLWLLMGGASAFIAQKRGRDPLVWFIIGTLLGLLSVVLLYILPAITKKAEPQYENIAGGSLPLESDLVGISRQYSNTEWYYLDRDHKQQGPVPFTALQTLWGDGFIAFNTYIWREGMSEWQTIEVQPFLADSLDFPE